mmetsp:Transcript_1859/g.2743  ORF Transcript_1859/g.2743 Transcript_1859/m.2743 type:complete len:222 (+) Transcript_1859:47-712(+)
MLRSVTPVKMAKLSLALLASLLSGAAAFAPAQSAAKTSAISATGFEEVGGEPWDPLSLGKLPQAGDTFPGMFPEAQFMQEAEIKHGRMAMLAWTGIWATHEGGLGLGWHFDGFPVEPDWTKALGVFAKEQPEWFGAILLFIAIAEGEGVGHSGDNFRGMSTKTPGDMGFDWMGLSKKLPEEKVARHKIAELKNGRAAMIAMASMFAYESIPGSVPIMDILN